MDEPDKPDKPASPASLTSIALRPADGQDSNILDAETIVLLSFGVLSVATQYPEEIAYVQTLKDFMVHSDQPSSWIYAGMHGLFEAYQEARRSMCTNPVAPVVQPDFYSFVNSGRLGDADNVGQMAVIYTLHGQRRLAAAVLQDNVLAHTCHLSKHAVACGDSCENDTGNLLVTKGDHYGVREKQGIIEVRNSGHPVMPSIPWTLNSRSLAEVEMWSAYMHVTGATGQAKSALTHLIKSDAEPILHHRHAKYDDLLERRIKNVTRQGETGLGPTVMAGLFQANSSRIRVIADEIR
ncbi:Imidazole glycerol phosphate synthase hisHF [Porphyridium purpureum]|uniref:Imidazole glycerol phosphate synthase hisHF n=1 Tax=Porphyridium purpureum TaxID=35688 RepID=A0A5J4YY93_PORPP|nr:Imidazole glycerol phosphate synthase hisHF [Porphyridium purpureum]|eukprot:POR8474..scf208_2